MSKIKNLILILTMLAQSFMLLAQEKTVYNSPPPVSWTTIRTPAEFEPVKTVVLQWDYNGVKKADILNLRQYNNLHSFLVKNIQLAGANVVIMVDNASVQTQITDSLQASGIPLTNVTFKVQTTNSIWCRDYSATSIYYGDTKQIGLVDWEYNRPRPSDDDSPVGISTLLGQNLFRADENSGSNELVGTGGNFMTDGFGLAISSKLIVNENGNNETKVKNIVKNYMGIDRYSLMNTLPYDGIHHIDMHTKLLDEETILVGQYPAGVSDGPSIEANLQTFLANFKTVYGHDFRVVRIPMLGNPANGADYQTYTNSLIVNNYVLVPIYGSASDNTALQVYRDAMPGYTVVGFNCADIIVLSGAIHCITHEINQDKIIRIKHPRFITGIAQNENLVINAELWANEAVTSVKAYVKFNGQTNYTEYNMTPNLGVYTVSVPCASIGEAKYYIKAQSANAVTYKPQAGATGGYFTIDVTTPTSLTENQLPKNTELYQNYPNPFNPETVISFYNNQNGIVKLSVYNSKGEEVSILVNNTLEKGLQTVKFNAASFNSGVYFYRLVTPEKTLTSKMMLVK